MISGRDGRVQPRARRTDLRPREPDAYDNEVDGLRDEDEDLDRPVRPAAGAWRAESQPMVPERRLRQVYQFERRCYEATVGGKRSRYRVPRQWDGGGPGDPEGRGLPSAWRKLVGLARRHEIDPVDYVQWSLAIGTLLLGRPPEPNQLLSLRRVDAYRADLPKRRELVALRLRLEMATAGRYITYLQVGGLLKEGSYANVLGDRSLEISPLLRHCLAVSIGGLRFRRFALIWEEPAAVQHQRDRAAYDELWRAVLPEGFAGRARTIHDRLVG